MTSFYCLNSIYSFIVDLIYVFCLMGHNKLFLQPFLVKERISVKQIAYFIEQLNCYLALTC